MEYRYCGQSGVQLPVISLGLWHNFGDGDDQSEATKMITTAFDLGVCHFDLANNYGNPAGSAETNFGNIIREHLSAHRDEMFISSKAGHDMWRGVYGTGSSRKNLIASCDQSLKRTGLEYFDVFYSHRYDGVTPVEETMQALVDIVRSGKALYAGISKYPPELQRRACAILADAHVPCLVGQYRYSMFDRKSEANIDVADECGTGVVCFSPLAQGLLTDRYFAGIPAESRAANKNGFLRLDQVTAERVAAAKELNEIAASRGQSLAEMALAWVLRDCRVTSVIVGASSQKQLLDNLRAIENLKFDVTELERINEIISQPGIAMY